MPDLALAQTDIGVNRVRRREVSLTFDKAKVVDRINTFYREDTQSKSSAIQSRLQRHAKLRMWTTGTGGPWEGSSDIALPDIMTHSLRIQDTLHNSVMVMRPAISANPIRDKQDESKVEAIDSLLDYQFFVENKGENIVGEAAESFVNEDSLTIYIPWIKEERDTETTITFDPIPPHVLPISYFKELVMGEFKKGNIFKKDQDGWEWEIEEGGELKKTEVSFYTLDDDRVEMVVSKEVTVFDGPAPRVLEWEEILHPPGVSNLQPPSPSNPNGSGHVIMVSNPTLDEVKRLKMKGYYDLLTDDDVIALEARAGTPSTTSENKEGKQQKDKLAGVVESTPTADSHKTLTRLMVFDCYDIDGDGLDEDVIWWMIYETGTLLRAKHLTSMFPSDPPRRPFAESSFIPVQGRRNGISLPELLEGTHDFLKQTADQTVDGGTISNMPFGFYRAASSLKQDIMKLAPGNLYPLGDPQNDINIPMFPGQSQAFGFNMMTLFSGVQDKLAMQGDLQFGRVPKGQASALRTVGGQQTLLAQGEARPERILRRFFMCLTEVFSQMHELNQRFLPPKKKFKVMGFMDKQDEVYREIKSSSEINGRYQFQFKANVLNSSKQGLQQAFSQMIPLYMNPMAIQLGIIQPDGIYRLMRDFGKSLGPDPDNYLVRPPPEVSGPPILAEEAISAIMNHEYPHGRPLEGPQAHLQKLIQFSQSPNFGLLDQDEVGLLQNYILQIRDQAIQEMKRQQLAQAAAQMNPQSPGSKQVQPPDLSQAPVQQNEMADETLTGDQNAQ